MMHAKLLSPGLAAVAVVAAASMQPARADSVQLDVNADAARAVYAWQVGDQLRADAGWLHHQDTGNIVHLGLHLVDFATGGERTLRAGLGGKLFLVDADRGDARGGALGLGAFFDYTFPQYNRLGLGGQLYFAPDVLGVSDVDGYREIEAYVRYNLLRDADVYLGVRNIQGKFDASPDVTFDTGLHIGIRLNF